MNNRGRNSRYAKINRRKTAKNEVISSLITAMPEAILLEIFFKLPILAIMNCKRVCTTWYKLIRHSSFTNTYARNSSFEHLVLPQSDTYGVSAYPFSFIEISEDWKSVETRIKPKLPCRVSARSSISVINSCNGLICLELETPKFYTVYVSNPVMGECFALPSYKNDVDCVTTHNFGFSQITNSFKVMRIVYREDSYEFIGDCSIFTVGVDNEWRSLVNISPWYSSTVDVILNGSFHWIIPDDNGACVIHTFDIGEEKHGYISYPHGLELKFRGHYLVSLDNHLCLIDNSKLSQVAIWTMKEYGVAESWTKDVLLASWFPSDVRFQDLKLVSLLKNGDMLHTDYKDKSFVSYNHKQKKYTKIEGFYSGDHFYATMTNTPSFLSLEEIIQGRQEQL